MESKINEVVDRVLESIGGDHNIDSKKWLICIDDSIPSQQGFFSVLYDLYQSSRNDIIYLFICDIPEITNMDEIIKNCEEFLKRKEESQKKSILYEIIRVSTKSRSEVGHKIVQYAESKHVHYIVMGTRKLSGIQKAIVGSVSSYVLLHAACPSLRFTSLL